MKRMLTIAIAVAAVLALPVSAHAARKTLFLETTKGALATGAELQLVSSDFTLSDGVAECQTTDILGTLTSNGSGKDIGSLTGAHFEGAEAEGACASPKGPATLVAPPVAWTLEMTAKNTTSIKAKKVTLVVSYPTAMGTPTCTYQGAKLKPTPIYDNGLGEAIVTLTEQTLKRNKKASSSQCPASTAANGAFALKSNGESVFGRVEEEETGGCEECHE
jgi:hypothetical protein